MEFKAGWPPRSNKLNRSSTGCEVFKRGAAMYNIKERLCFVAFESIVIVFWFHDYQSFNE